MSANTVSSMSSTSSKRSTTRFTFAFFFFPRFGSSEVGSNDTFAAFMRRARASVSTIAALELSEKTRARARLPLAAPVDDAAICDSPLSSARA